MASPKTKLFKINENHLYGIRVTAERLYVDILDAFGEKVHAYCYVDYWNTTLQKPHYTVSIIDRFNGIKRAATIKDIIDIIQEDLNITIPEEAIDEFMARVILKIMKR